MKDNTPVVASTIALLLLLTLSYDVYADNSNVGVWNGPTVIPKADVGRGPWSVVQVSYYGTPNRYLHARGCQRALRKLDQTVGFPSNGRQLACMKIPKRRRCTPGECDYSPRSKHVVAK